MKKFEVTINTPENQLYHGLATSVNAPGIEGQMTILANHAPLLSKLATGKVKITTPSEEKELQIKEGFIEVNKKAVSLLVKV